MITFTVIRRPICILITLLCSHCNLWSDDDANQTDDQPLLTAEDTAFFESKIRPVLIKHCYECHSSENDEGGLRVDVRDAIRSGGDRGPAVVPGQAQSSVLLDAIEHRDPELQMPPKRPKLSAEVIADFRKWIQFGAPDPRVHGDESAAPWSAGGSANNDHWAYRSPVRSQTPQIGDSAWPRHEIDCFIFERLSSHDLVPSPDAEPHTLLRRLYFDLIGLPPSPEDVDHFLLDQSRRGIDAALADTVDRLLQSPQFGVRWGRHWLDVARFGESSGGESNVSFPYAWRYRDYVIDSVDQDVPLDRFLTEQIAGDLLPFEEDAQRARLLIATGFLAVGTKNLGENNDSQFLADMIDEQIDSLTRAVTASSVACARCHDHKFDPFTMEDYYALAGIFASTKTFFGTFTSPANNRGGDPLVLPHVPGQKIFNKSLSPKQFSDLKARHMALDQVRQQIQASQQARFARMQPEKAFTLREVLANLWQLGPVEGKLETLDSDGLALPVAMGVLDGETIINAPLLARGEVARAGAIIPRGFPKAIRVDKNIPIPQTQSGRLELARWLTDDSHPLTSRVYVNRVWKHLFGQGLVPTVDNFGTTGRPATHPQLLDTLAVDFVNQGWSTKRLIRTIVLSRTYRQSSTFSADAFDQDPDNQWLWRLPKRRLEAEAIRDAMLFVSGELDLSRPDGSLVATAIGDRPISLIGLDKNLPDDLDGSTHRSAYLPVIRDRLPSVLELFDFAQPSLVTGERETTNVPVQSLYLMNSPFVQERSRAFANRLDHETDNDRDAIERAFRLCFSRSPDSTEMAACLRFLQQGTTIQERQSNRVSFCQALLATAEFRNLD